MIQSLIQEIDSRSNEATGYTIQSIYFGGGTPSLLNESELKKIIKTVYSKYSIDLNAEVTLEANPDDIDADYLQLIRQVGINRLSIGIQSFFETDLQWMNRAHTARQSFESIELSIAAGFQNFSIDLIYGLPNSDLDLWSANLKFILQYQIPHISCYALTIEERTALHHQVSEKTIQLPHDSSTIDQMDRLLDFCDSNYYEAYEISNFAKQGFRSRHNSSYWEGLPYFGFGPAAHSFDKGFRRWNIANNALYIQAIQNQLPYFDSEALSKKDQCNEYIMLQLRRIEGLDLHYLENHFEEFSTSIQSELIKQINLGNITIQNGKYVLSRQGKHLADEVSSSLFVT